MKKTLTIFNTILLPLLLLLLTVPVPQTFGAMDDYCVSPPFIAQSITPNILIVLDNSGSMCEAAYSGQYNPSQFNNGLYYGLFDGTKNYKYTTNNRWEVTTDAMSTGTKAHPIANGSFLNYITMLRTDVSKKLLIGGKANPRTYTAGNTVKLYTETGCDGRNDPHVYSPANTLIEPFSTGNAHQFTVKQNGTLEITELINDATYNLFPQSDLSLPPGLGEYPTAGAVIAWNKIDESTSDGDDTYITFGNSTEPVIMGFAPPTNSLPGDIKVKVYVRAKKTTSTTAATRYIAGVLNIDGANYFSATQNIGTSYDTYTFSWNTNPATGLPWQADEIKKLASTGKLLGFGIQPGGNNYLAAGTPIIRVTQAYLQVTADNLVGGPYNIIVDQGTTKAEGLIDTLDGEVRFGLSYYNYEEGGLIDKYVGFKNTANLIQSIQDKVPGTWTPLGETLREAVRYFRQDAPVYDAGDYTKASGNFTGTDIYRDPYAYKFEEYGCQRNKHVCALRQVLHPLFNGR